MKTSVLSYQKTRKEKGVLIKTHRDKICCSSNELEEMDEQTIDKQKIVQDKVKLKKDIDNFSKEIVSADLININIHWYNPFF